METFSEVRFGFEFGSALDEESIEFDYERAFGDIESLMLGEARNDSVGFHAQKLRCMSLVVRHSLSALTHETGETDYKPEDSMLDGKWKSLLGEDLPPVSLLISSANLVAGEAENFVAYGKSR